jgi:hypothetical protein
VIWKNCAVVAVLHSGANMSRSAMNKSTQKTPVILLAACVVMQFALLEIRWILHRLLGPETAPDSVPKQIA